jgi:hypothetical protein
MRLPFCRILLFLAALFAPAAAVTATSFPVSMEKDAPVEVSMETVWNDLLITPGFIPIKITLRNKTNRAQRYILNYRIDRNRYRGGKTMTGSAALSVEAGHVSQTHVFIPANFSQPESGLLLLGLKGLGVKDNTYYPSGKSFSDTHIAIGMGERSAFEHQGRVNALVMVNEHISASRINHSFYRIPLATVPPDWRAYSSLAMLVFDSTEWNDLPAGNRAAILEWTAMGGKLCLIALSDEWLENLRFPDINIPDDTETDEISLPLGAGNIVLFPPEKPEPPVRKEIKRVPPSRPVRKGDIQLPTIKHTSAPPMKREIEIAEKIAKAIPARIRNPGANKIPLSAAQEWEPQINKGIIVSLLVLFTLALGPLNFFFLAPARRRHRILWTTPLIAFAVSLFLMGAALLDGIGGRGERLTIARLLPEQKRLVLEQAQISRTGLLLNSSFDFDENIRLSAMFADNDSRSRNYTRTSAGWSGDWFSSRAMQAQFAQTIRPARGVVRVTLPGESGKNGAVLSTLETPLAEIYVTPDGKIFYKAAHLVPGVKCPLIPASRAEFKNWWEEQTKTSFSRDLFPDTPSDGKNPSKKFYARAAKADQVAVATLKSITWERDIALIHGAAEFVTETAAPPVPVNEPPAANAPAAQVAKVLDFAERYRNLPFIGVLKPECQNPVRWE